MKKFSYAELFSLSFWGTGSVSFRILAGADIEIFLKDFPEVFPIAETGSFCYFSHGIFPFFQQLGSMFQTDIPYEICRCLAGQRFQFTVETGTAHVEQGAKHINREARIVHVVLYILLDAGNEFPVQIRRTVDAFRVVGIIVQLQIAVSVAQ